MRSIERQLFEACLVLVAVAAMLKSDPVTAAGAEVPTRRKPSIVVVVVDDLRRDDLGCYGHPFVKTPNIDRVAAEGVLFTNGFCTTPLCSPVRASILTGRYPHANGIIDNTNRSARSHKLVTFPRLLRDAGYSSAFVGKWHMGNDSTPRPGFDYWACLKGQGQANNPELNEGGKIQTVEGYVTDILTDRAVGFIERTASKPFILFLAHKALVPNLAQADDGSVSKIGSGERIPAERHKSLYADAPIPRRANIDDDLSGKPALRRRTKGMPPLSRKTGTSDKTIRDRLRMLMAVDESVGRLTDAIEQTGRLDGTVFVFTSDHGYFYGEHGLDYQSRLAYEETLRIPLLVRYPRMVKAQSTIDFTTLSIDLFPSLLELAGVAVPKNVHGRSLVPLLRGEDLPPRRSFLIEYYSDTVWPRIRNMGYKAVRTDRWKYVQYTELYGMDELYDLKADPYELTNLIGRPGTEDVLHEMRRELERLIRETP